MVSVSPPSAAPARSPATVAAADEPSPRLRGIRFVIAIRQLMPSGAIPRASAIPRSRAITNPFDRSAGQLAGALALHAQLDPEAGPGDRLHLDPVDDLQRHGERVVARPQVRARRGHLHDHAAPVEVGEVAQKRHPSASITAGRVGAAVTSGSARRPAVSGSLRPCPVRTQTTSASASSRPASPEPADAGQAGRRGGLAEDARMADHVAVGGEDLVLADRLDEPARLVAGRDRLVPRGGVPDPDRGRERLRVLHRMAEHERRGALRLEAPHPRQRVDAPGGLPGAEAHPVGADVARRCRPGSRGTSGARPRSSQTSNAAVFWPSSRYGLTEFTSVIGCSSCSASSRTIRSAASKLPSTARTRAPAAWAWSSFPAAILPAGSTTTTSSPAAAPYAAAEAEVLPVLAQTMERAPASSAFATAITMPRSLNDPVGFVPSNLRWRFGIPQAAPSRSAWTSGVAPSPRLTMRRRLGERQERAVALEQARARRAGCGSVMARRPRPGRACTCRRAGRGERPGRTPAEQSTRAAYERDSASCGTAAPPATSAAALERRRRASFRSAAAATTAAGTRTRSRRARESGRVRNANQRSARVAPVAPASASGAASVVGGREPRPGAAAGRARARTDRRGPPRCRVAAGARAGRRRRSRRGPRRPRCG